MAPMRQRRRKGPAVVKPEIIPNRTPFPFLDLPYEIRVCVYQELLVTDDRLIMSWRGPKLSSRQCKKMYPAVLQTCKQCAEEGAQVLYGENLFDFEEVLRRASTPLPFLSRVGPTNPSLIRLIVCEYPAANEELASRPGGQFSKKPQDRTPLLSIERLRDFFRLYRISLDQLRFFAVSIMPYGRDDFTVEIMKGENPFLLGMGMELDRQRWLKKKNAWMEDILDTIRSEEHTSELSHWE